jgi:hypothetical protein
MTDESNRRDLLAKLLAMKDLPWTPETDLPVPNHASALSHAQIDAVRTALAGEVRDWLEDRSLATKTLGSMTKEQLNAVHDAAYSALMNAAPIVRSYTARKGRDPYPIWIAGIDGVYLLIAAEHDTLGPFTTLADAVDVMERNYGAFLVGDGSS